MLIDSNLLLYSADRASVHNEAAAQWLGTVLSGNRRVGFPWQSLGTFVRIITSPRIAANPMSAEQAWSCVQSWLNAGPAWIPPATGRTAAILGELIVKYHLTGNLVPDAMLVALAVEHGLTIMSADTDFARFKEIRWENPLALSVQQD